MTYRVTRQEMSSATVADNTQVVRAAAQALGLLGDPEALWTLVDLAELRPERELVGAAAQAIARIGTEAAAEFLEELALDEAPARRAGAAEALEFLSGPEAPAVLWPLLRDEDPQVRRCAAASLGRRPPGEVWERLRQALCDPGEVLRDSALAVLREQIDRDGLGPDEVESLAQWAQADAEAQAAVVGCLEPVAEEAARARSRLERRQREVRAPAPPAPRPPPPSHARRRDRPRRRSRVPPGAPHRSGSKRKHFQGNRRLPLTGPPPRAMPHASIGIGIDIDSDCDTDSDTDTDLVGGCGLAGRTTGESAPAHPSTCSRALARSSQRSSGSSRPTERRSSPGPMPRARRWASGMAAWLMVQG